MGARFLLTKNLYLKVFIAFSIGVFTADMLNKPFWVLVPVGLFALNSLFNSYFKIKRSKIVDNTFFSLIVVLGIGFHYFNHEFSREKQQTSLYALKEKPHVYLFRVDEKPQKKRNSFRLEGNILGFLTPSGDIAEINSKSILYLALDAARMDSLKYGTIIAFKSKIQFPKSQDAEFEFNYGKWLERKKIYSNFYVNVLEIVGTEVSFFYRLTILPKWIRDYYETVIDRYVLDPSSNDVAKSILIGVRTDMDRDLLQSYSDTGTIHILSVSGLHFAILILLINWILGKFMKESNLKMIIKHSISFSYALITGFSPPVFRSFLMFLLLDVEKKSKINPSVINIVFLSAWIILLYDTNQLFDIGFQLSYAAILGIVLWQNKMEWKLYFDSKLMNYLWKSTCTLVAATVFTMPFVAYYFHKLSFLGLLSNYLVIPLTLISMYTGFALLSFSWIDIVGIGMGHLLSFLIFLQNDIILWFSHLRFSSFDGIYLSKPMLILSLCTLLVLNLFLFLKKKYELKILLSLIFAFFTIGLYERKLKANTEEWRIIPTYKKTAFLHSYGSRIDVFSDSLEPNAETFFLNNFRMYKGCAEDSVFYRPLNSYYRGYRMVYGTNPSSNPNYLVLCRENRKRWKEFITANDSFILPASLGPYYSQDLKDYLDDQKKHYVIQ